MGSCATRPPECHGGGFFCAGLSGVRTTGSAGRLPLFCSTYSSLGDTLSLSQEISFVGGEHRGWPIRPFLA